MALITHVFEKQMIKRLSSKTQFKIEFLLPFPGSRKVLEKIPEEVGVHPIFRQISTLVLLLLCIYVFIRV